MILGLLGETDSGWAALLAGIACIAESKAEVLHPLVRATADTTMLSDPTIDPNVIRIYDNLPEVNHEFRLLLRMATSDLDSYIDCPSFSNSITLTSLSSGIPHCWRLCYHR